MHAVKLEEIPEPRRPAPALIGELSDTYRLNPAGSPTHALQERLVQAYLTPTPATPTVIGYTAPARVAIIAGLAAASWVAIGSISVLIYALAG